MKKKTVRKKRELRTGDPIPMPARKDGLDYADDTDEFGDLMYTDEYDETVKQN